MEERINPRVIDEGDGCFTLVADSPEEAERLRVILGPSACGLGVSYEDPGPVATEEDEVSQELDAGGLVCCVDDEPWPGSVCEIVTGLDEEAAKTEIARLQVLLNTKDLGGN